MDASGLNPKFTTHVRELERRVGRGDARCILLHMYYRIHTAYAAFVCGLRHQGLPRALPIAHRDGTRTRTRRSWRTQSLRTLTNKSRYRRYAQTQQLVTE
jgi:hypothetical protein